MADTTPTTPASTLHPEALLMLDSFRQELADFNRSKLAIEYRVQSLRAKNLGPNADGSAPEGLAVGEAGRVGESAIEYADYLGAMLALGALVTALEADLPTGVATETALLRFARGR